MADAKPVLRWHSECGEWFADAGGFSLRVEQERDYYLWSVHNGELSRERPGPNGLSSLLAAQLAAESAALAWLSEGVASFGARVLTAVEWPVVARVLAKTGELHNLPALGELAHDIEGGGHA